MSNLKRISRDAVDVAVDKADHYRLLNEPHHAESICLDVLEVDPKNQRAVINLLLSLTDQFASRLHDAHQHAEYDPVCERCPLRCAALRGDAGC